MLNCQREKFIIPDDIAYLNCAYMSPLMKSVIDVGKSAVEKKGHPYAIKPEDFFEDSQRLREEFANLINAPDANKIAIIPAVSYGFANVTKNLDLSANQNIIIVGEQFPSNVYPWLTLSNDSGAKINIIHPPENPLNRGEIWNQLILENINQQTAVVTIGSVHWADGTFFDLKSIRKRTNEVGALLFVDGTQSVGAYPFDLQEIKPDALICAAYKWLLGPYTIGLAYYGEYFNQGKPVEENWINRLYSEDFAGLVNYQDEYQIGAVKYDMGERANFILVPMAIKALQQLNQWGPDNIQDYCRNLVEPFLNELADVGFQVENMKWRGSHLTGIRIPGSADVGKIKTELEKNKVYVSIRGNAIRIATHLYNNQADFEKLVDSLKRALP